MDGKKDKPLKPKKPIKKKSVKRKRKPRKPVVKKSVTQKQTVTQNVKVLVNNIRQRRRNRRTLIDKQPLQPQPQQPAVITIAPTFSQPQLIQPPQPQFMQPQLIQPQPQAVIQPQLTATERTVIASEEPSLTPVEPTRIEPAPAEPVRNLIRPARAEPPRPQPVGGLLGEIRAGRGKLKKVELGEGAPKTDSVGEITPPPRRMETDLMSQIIKRGQELKPVSQRVDKPKAKPATEPKKTALDIMKEKLKAVREVVEPEEEIGAFSVEAEPVIKPQIEVVEATPLLRPTGRESPTLEDLTEGLETTPQPKKKKEKKKTEAIFTPAGEAKEGEPITLKQKRGTGEKTRGIPKKAEEAFKKYLQDYTVIKESPSSTKEGVIKTKSLKYREGGELLDDFKELMKLTGDTEKALQGKLKRASQGKEIKIV